MDRKFITQSFDYSVEDLVGKLRSGDIDLSPHYQRDYVWADGAEDETLTSRLIESLWENFPIPVIYLAELDTLKYEVIDGQQRLTSFRRYMNDEFTLQLGHNAKLNGKTYSELEPIDRDKIRKRGIKVLIIGNESDKSLKKEAYIRLNTGSIPVSYHDIRRANFEGPFEEMLKKLLKESADINKALVFKRIIENRDSSKQEMLLRFLYLSSFSPVSSIKNTGLSKSLDIFMEYNKDSSNLEEYREKIVRTFSKVFELRGEGAFSQFRKNGGSHSYINRALYDAEMLGMFHSKFYSSDHNFSYEEKERYLSQLRKRLDEDLGEKISGSDTDNKLRDRVEIVQGILNELS